MRPLFVSLTLLLGLTAAAPSRADVAPPGGETCTEAKQWGPDEACEWCGTNREAPEACTTQYANTPFTQRCQTSGATVWSELWCKPDAGNPGRKTGCGCGGGEGSFALLLGLLRRRRPPVSAA